MRCGRKGPLLRSACACGLLLAVLLAPSAASGAPRVPNRARDRDRPLRAASTAPGWSWPDYVAVRAGLGNGLGGLGLQLATTWRLGESFELGPFLGAGAMFGEDQAPTLWTGAGGVQAHLGHEHRFMLELGYEPIAYRNLALHGVVIAHEALYGVALPIGYEYASDGGFTAHLILGPAITTEADFHWLGAASLALGARWGS